jgi:hypothetical protein
MTVSAIANQESLSGLETEMRKLEGIVKEIVDEMDYLKKREERFQNTNGMPYYVFFLLYMLTDVDSQYRQTFVCKISPGLQLWRCSLSAYGR